MEYTFISGIDTDAGKTYITGMLAKRLMEKGHKVATQKFIQTGNDTWSEDIEAHRKIMGIEMLPEDLDHTTAPVIFSYPASAQLAARIDGRDIDLDIIKKIDRYSRLTLRCGACRRCRRPYGTHYRRLLHHRLCSPV